MKPHSAAWCQCNSRTPPALRRMFTPEMESAIWKIADVGRGRDKGFWELPRERGILRSRVDGAARIALGVDDALGRLIRVAEARGARTWCESADGCGRAC